MKISNTSLAISFALSSVILLIDATIVPSFPMAGTEVASTYKEWNL
jgi:hypothetical protein